MDVKNKEKPPLIPPKGGGHIIYSFALSSFGGVGGGFHFLGRGVGFLNLLVSTFWYFLRAFKREACDDLGLHT